MKPKLQLISGSALHNNIAYKYGNMVIRGHSSGHVNSYSFSKNRRSWTVEDSQGHVVAHPHSLKLAKAQAIQFQEANP